MIEDRHAHGLALDRPIVIDPFGARAPGRLAFDAFARDDRPLRNRTGKAHRRRKADRHRAFLGVAENNRAVRGDQRDVEIDDPSVLRRREPHRALIRQDRLALLRNPAVADSDQPCFARGDFQKLGVLDCARLFGFGPEIHAVDIAMGEPERTVMHMVGRFVFGFGHRIVAHHRQALRPQHRIEERPGNIGVAIFGEKLAADGDGDFAVELGDANGILRRDRTGKRQQGRAHENADKDTHDGSFSLSSMKIGAVRRGRRQHAPFCPQICGPGSLLSALSYSAYACQSARK
ncbi:MAG: hypothetical protein BWZ10_02504 [candidate division BRC1 bacterium ADurb.BinA364]|nr:MAG: hypothetical protein BWZ10_02504 [candidate division BRC1 bacterium ADurb.BinA364]